MQGNTGSRLRLGGWGGLKRIGVLVAEEGVGARLGGSRIVMGGGWGRRGEGQRLGWETCLE